MVLLLITASELLSKIVSLCATSRLRSSTSQIPQCLLVTSLIDNSRHIKLNLSRCTTSRVSHVSPSPTTSNRHPTSSSLPLLDPLPWYRFHAASMADFTGMMVEATLKNPPNIIVRGKVANVVAGQTLTLQNGEISPLIVR